MLRIVLGILFLFFVTGRWTASGQVIIEGNAPDYAGRTLFFSTYTNQISNSERVVATVYVKANGDFKFEAEISKVEYIFCHYGIFFMYLYAEPGNEYTIKLPQRIERKPEDKINPFFEEVRVHLLVNSSRVIKTLDIRDNRHELNFLIRTFDDYYDPFYNKYAMKVFTNESVKDMDSTLQKIERTFGETGDSYFRRYYFYRIGLLKFMSTRFKSRNISDNYFLNKPILYDNPAYMELFNKVYDKYFVFFGRTKSGEVIYEDINKSKSLTKLKVAFDQDKVLSNDTLKEFVILKGLHDGFYEAEFQRKAILEILDSLIETTKLEQIKETGKEIRYKITKLLAGYPPPAFQLLNQDSVWTTIGKFKGSFVYLFFGTTQNYACLKEFQMLKKIQDKHPGLLNVVVISADNSWNEVRSFAKKSPFKWSFLYYGNHPNVLKEYDIRTIPTGFLIDREGKLALSPAPLPSENFEEYFFNYLRARKIL
ncbi:MAG TPA: thioredoxin-like domain-containing protein [Bacteroidales bacterium]